MISICIPTYNRLRYLKRCLSSIFNGFGDYPYEVIIADGGSTDGTLEYLRKLKNITLIEQEKLSGAVKASNACFKMAKGDYIMLIADDASLVPKVLIEGCKLMDKYPEIGLVCPRILLEPGRLHSVTRRWIKQYWSLLSLIFIVRTSVLREMGYFNERFRTYFADSDISLTVLKLGYTTIFTREVGVSHFRFQDESHVTLAYTLNRAKRQQDMEYGWKKWEFLRIKIKEYMRHSPFKRYKSTFFNFIGAAMYGSKRLRPFLQPFVKRNNKFVLKLYDWLLEQTVIFNDKNYAHLEDFFLAQKYPDEIVSFNKHL